MQKLALLRHTGGERLEACNYRREELEDFDLDGAVAAQARMVVGHERAQRRPCTPRVSQLHTISTPAHNKKERTR